MDCDLPQMDDIFKLTAELISAAHSDKSSLADTAKFLTTAANPFVVLTSWRTQLLTNRKNVKKVEMPSSE